MPVRESLYDHGSFLFTDHNHTLQEPGESPPEISFHLARLSLPAVVHLLRSPRHDPGRTKPVQQSLNWVSITPSLYITTSHLIAVSHNPHSRTSTSSNPTRPRAHSPPPHWRLFPTLNLWLLCRITSNRALLIICSIIMILVSLFGMIAS